MGKIVEIEHISHVIKNLKNQNKKIVATNGCFDILHVGHVKYLAQAKELGDILVVGINSDNSVKELKGPTRPINNEQDRAEVLAALSAVDYVVIFEEIDAINFLSMVKPDIYAKGGDYTVESLPESKTVLQNGGKIEFIKFVDGKSTTNIIEKAKS